MRPLNICMLTTSFPRFAGDLFGTFILELSRALAAAGHQVEVVAPHAAGTERHGRVEGVAVERFCYAVPARLQRLAYGGGIPTNLRRSWLARALVPFFFLGFWWKARRRGPGADVVHCHWSPVGLIGWAAAGGRPVVLSVRGSDVHWMGGGLMARINRLAYRKAAAVVAVSRDIAQKLTAAGVPAAKVHVVPNGVDGRFCPGDRAAARQRLQLPPAETIVLFVGLIVPVKGLDVLLEALKKLGPRPLCVLVGGGAAEADLQRQAAAAGLDGRLVWAGPQPTTEIPAWMQAADALVLPSRSEGRPNVVLEAQACGLPVVATRVGGTPELIEDGVDGLLVPPEDPGPLAAALARLVEDAGLRRRLGRQAHASIARRQLTWQASAEGICKVYAEVLQERRDDACAA